ncbi:MAG: hypothetical protein AAGB34_04980 [Planctomycetota bacterium]
MSIQRFCKAIAMVAFAASTPTLTTPSASAQTVDCVCSSTYSVGDRVVALVDNPNFSTDLPQGTEGTVICGDDNDGVGDSILIRWDNWTDGFPSNTASCICPVVSSPGTAGDWFVGCNDIALVLDSDGDGVLDIFDACPGEDDLADPDQDGVLGCFDNCPNDPNVTNTRTGVFYPTVASAIAAAADGDVLQLGPCAFNEQSLSLNSRDLTIRGQGAGVTVIDGGAIAGAIFEIHSSPNIVLEGMTLRNGLGNDQFGGGAIHSRNNSVVTVRDCDFVANDGGAPAFTGAVFGAIGGSLTFERCRFLQNILVRPGNGPATDILVQQNTQLNLINCLFAEGVGTARQVVGNFGASISAVNCTFADFGDGSGGRAAIGVFTDGSVDVHNSVATTPMFNGNAATVLTLSRNVFPGGSGTNTNGVPTFVDAANGDYRLAGGSLGVDAADSNAYQNAGGGILDLAGNDRTNNDLGTVDTGTGVFAFLDAGAYEFQGSSAQRNPDYNTDTFVDIFDITDLQQDVENFNAP